jgi:hypothetical protein
VEASGRVLAAVLEQSFVGEEALTNAAYNAFGPADLAAAWTIVLRGGLQHAVILNPGEAPARARLSFLQRSGEPIAAGSLDLDAGAMAIYPIMVPDLETDQLLVEGDADLAVLDYITPLTSPAQWGRWGEDTVAEWAIAMPAPSREPEATPPTPTASPDPGQTPGSATPTASPEATAETPTPEPSTWPPPPPVYPPIYLPWSTRP